MSTSIIGIRLTPTELSTIDALCEVEHYRSRSHWILAAIEAAFDSHRVNEFTRLAIRGERVALRVRRNLKKGKTHGKTSQTSVDARADGPSLFDPPRRKKVAAGRGAGDKSGNRSAVRRRTSKGAKKRGKSETQEKVGK